MSQENLPVPDRWIEGAKQMQREIDRQTAIQNTLSEKETGDLDTTRLLMKKYPGNPGKVLPLSYHGGRKSRAKSHRCNSKKNKRTRRKSVKKQQRRRK
jgi:hypothetical protein